jgi:hypothetical protein
MSLSLRTLKAAVSAFVNRPTEDDVDPEELWEVVDELEGELDKLYESPEERAAADAAVAKAIERISATYGPRS